MGWYEKAEFKLKESQSFQFYWDFARCIIANRGKQKHLNIRNYKKTEIIVIEDGVGKEPHGEANGDPNPRFKNVKPKDTNEIVDKFISDKGKVRGED